MDGARQTAGENPDPTDSPTASGGDAVTAGRVLTAITCAVLLIGLLVIRGTGGAAPSDGNPPTLTVEPRATASADAKPSKPAEPIVLQPSPPEPPAAPITPLGDWGASTDGRRDPTGAPARQRIDVAARPAGPSGSVAR